MIDFLDCFPVRLGISTVSLLSESSMLLEKGATLTDVQSAKLPIDPKVVLPILLPNLTKAPEKVLLGSCRTKVNMIPLMAEV